MPVPKGPYEVNIGKIIKDFRYAAAKIDLSPAEISRLQTNVRGALTDLSKGAAIRTSYLMPRLAKEKFEGQIADILDEVPMKVVLQGLSQQQTEEVKLMVRNAILRGSFMHIAGFSGGQTVTCEMKYNPDVIDVSHSVKCSNGHYFCDKHKLVNCPICGSPVR